MTYRYQEQISVHPIVKVAYLAMLLVFVLTLTDADERRAHVVVFLIGTMLIAIPLLFGRLVFELHQEAIHIRFGYLGWPGRIVPLETVERTEVVTYRPIRQFGGWGIRGGKFRGEFTGVYSLRGNRGLLFYFNEDTRFLMFRARRLILGSREPDKLQQAIGR